MYLLVEIKLHKLKVGYYPKFFFNPCIPYFEVRILAFSKTIVLVTTKVYLLMSASNKPKVANPSGSVISFVRTFFEIVVANSIFEISERKTSVIFVVENISSRSAVPASL